MVLNVRQRQAEAIVRMLHFNAQPSPVVGSQQEDDSFKVLILDRFTKDIIAPLLHVNELRRHGVTLHMLLDADRQSIPDVPAVYFVQPTQGVVDRITADAARGLYQDFHINFSTHIPRPLIERLATASVGSGAAARISRIYDQHSQFISLEPGVFSLGLPSTYLQLNDPRASDTSIESAVTAVVDGLFCVLTTLGVVPIVRCPPGGAAEHVAAALDARLRDALQERTNLFTEATGGSLAASLQRPLLCLFDRTFELSVALQHVWTYQPLVQDVLQMRLNRIALDASPTSAGIPYMSSAAANARSYEVDDADFFWRDHGREQFPKIAEQVEMELAKYKASVDELNRATGANLDPSADPSEFMSANTRGLMSAVSSLPELTERKRTIDKHTNLATALLRSIKERGLDRFYQLEEDLVGGKADVDAVITLISSMQGSPMDKLRLALVWLLTVPSAPSEADSAKVEAALSASGVDLAAWTYVKRMRRMNLTGKGQGQSDALGVSALGGKAQGQLASLLGSTFGQGLSSLTKGVKTLLAGEQQAAVTVAVESLMDAKPNPETDGYLTFDAKAPPGKSQRPVGSFKEAIVFMIGGGNYLERESLVCWSARAVPGPKHIVYGATELLNGEDFVRQLADLGRASVG